MHNTSAFKAYDIRGKLPEQLNNDLSYRIGRAYADFLKPKKVAVGYDIRLSSPELAESVIKGLNDSGVEVLELGLVGTEEVYFATDHLNLDGGIMVTASHNPKDYNGMKLVKESAKPISGDSGLNEIKALVESANYSAPVESIFAGKSKRYDISEEYTQHLLSFIEAAKLKPLKVVVNAGNGAAGHMLDNLEEHLPFEFIKVNHQPDGNFPNGIPNPLLPENREDTRKAVVAHKADFGVAWDGDVDRCFLFDENGDFIEGYYIVGLLAKAFLAKQPGSKIIHDPRLTWNTIDIVNAEKGEAIQSKTGHAFIKERMRAEDAVYGGEMSAHHYFRDFAYCDSGMLPWLLIAELVSNGVQSLSQYVKEQQANFPISGEINSTLGYAKAAVDAVLEAFKEEALVVDKTDGISLEFEQWRFNLRSSNTEPVVRLNVESRGDQELMKQKTQQILTILQKFK
ncbi:phosphomannomutase [Agarivorans sp. B2Z047]|uniref:phosphomannomutase n=1 Tax=Agarivorans sp. B2Z047 TaxID=2652721 RepID=UPI00128DCFE0|nr:phosphomannomutase [Agarivorans sp. B2Z047]MPW31458.1 phosphomannomutase [Agarivorans sp. B2Z047]UQN42500.1 phosphomannomutase CpsG [Agarivorans sp. B2Z047]